MLLYAHISVSPGAPQGGRGGSGGPRQGTDIFHTKIPQTEILTKIR